MRIKKVSGFTIIEVALVLAIAGLIFLMIFIALPSLQRLQRDTARREDMTKLITTVKKFQSNNRGSLPTLQNANGDDVGSTSAGISSKNSWADFYKDYLGDDFVDPSGSNYSLKIRNCGANVDGDECTNNIVRGVANTTFPNGYNFVIALQATCDGPKAVGSSNPRKIAVLYVLEGSGAFCMNS